MAERLWITCVKQPVNSVDNPVYKHLVDNHACYAQVLPHLSLIFSARMHSVYDQTKPIKTIS
jgi:hypothetical protein